MAAYIIQRVGRALISLIIFVTLLFLFVMVIPGEKKIVTIPVPTSEVNKAPLQDGEEGNDQAQTQPTGVVISQKPNNTNIKPPVEGLPLEDIEAYIQDVSIDQSLSEPILPEGTQGDSAAEESQTQGQPSTDPAVIVTNPSTIQIYLYWVRNLLRGDLGLSTTFRRPVTDLLGELAPRTLLLFLPSLLIGFTIGAWLGSIITWKRGGLFEFFTSLAGVGFYTAFAPWLGFLLVSLFAYYLVWLPAANHLTTDVWLNLTTKPNTVINWILGTMMLAALLILGVWLITRKLNKRRTIYRLTGTLLVIILIIGLWIASGYIPLAWDILKHSILPMATLILLTFGGTMLMMRVCMTDILREDFVVIAQAKGLPSRQIRDQHVARLALIPVVTRFVLELPVLVISGFAIERVFSWDGLGQELFRSAGSADYPMLMGVMIVAAVVIMFAHLFVDIMTPIIDPRLRESWQREGR